METEARKYGYELQEKGSCGITNTYALNQSLEKTNSPFTYLHSTLPNHEGKKTLYCTCLNCNKKVNAEIYDGEIHCPNCGSSAPYKC